eukprot:COSAG02_NODE_53976_length_298_cov_1.402010_1_plen_52_part_01
MGYAARLSLSAQHGWMVEGCSMMCRLLALMLLPVQAAMSPAAEQHTASSCLA